MVAHPYCSIDNAPFEDDDTLGMDIALYAGRSLDFNAVSNHHGANDYSAENGVGGAHVSVNDAGFSEENLFSAAYRAVNGPIDLDDAVALDITNDAHSGADDRHAGFGICIFETCQGPLCGPFIEHGHRGEDEEGAN